MNLPVDRNHGVAERPREPMAAVRYTERFDHCLRSIHEMACELEQTAQDAIFTTDARGIITSCSEGACELLRLEQCGAVGRHVGSLYAGGFEEARAVMDRLLAEGRIRNYFTSILTPQGGRTPISLSASLIRDARGEVAGTLGIAHNLTEVRKLEDALAAQNRFMANILQDSADAILTLDADDVILSWNRGAEQIFGYNAAEAVGKPLDLVVPPDLKNAQELAHIAQRLRTHGSVRSHQTERLTKDGRRIQVVFTRTAIRDDSGAIVGSSAVLKDVTNVLQLERQLVYWEHMANLGELSAGLAHEIKNPLAGIKGAIEVIRDCLSARDSNRAVLGDVLHEVDRIDKTVRDLLSYAKPKTPTHSEIHLAELAQRIVAMVRVSSKNASVRFGLSVKGEIPPFTGDAGQLEQVLLNLLLNAQKAMPTGGTAETSISYNRCDATVRIEVRDTGAGIPKELQRRIFQPFFSTRPDGTGLGLALAVKNVQYHGGSIEVESEPGRGARFVVTIPMVCRL